MARAKDDPYFDRLFEESDGGKTAAGDREEARARMAARREVLGILDGAGEDASVEPLDDGLMSAYLDDALAAPERASLEARLAASATLREQVAAAVAARAAALESPLALPAAFAPDYDAVPGPASAAQHAPPPKPTGLIAGIFGGPSPARRWLAATVPVLAVVVVAAVVGRQWLGERTQPQFQEVSGAAAGKSAPDALVKSKRAEEREAKPAKRDAQPKPAEAAKPQPAPRPRLAERSGRAEGDKEAKRGISGGDKKIAVLTTTVVPLSSELRDAVVILGQSQQGAIFAPQMKSEAERRSAGPLRPSTGSNADKAAREPRKDAPGAGLLRQRPQELTAHHIQVIDRAIASDCAKDPSACCGSHQVDQGLLNRLLTRDQTPLHSVKVLHLSSRACYLTLP